MTEEVKEIEVAIKHIEARNMSAKHLNMAIEALKKQTPKKIEKSGYAFICPICHTWLQSPQQYCHECGQKINWY